MPVTISGLSSDIDTEGIINKLVEAEKIPIKRLQEEKNLTEQQKKAWEIIKEEIIKFDKTVKELYGFRSVFQNKKEINNDYFTLTPTRKAKISKHNIEIESLAQRHKIYTDPIPLDKNLNGIVFELSVGGTSVKVDGFSKGGTAKELVNTINNEAGDIVTAELIKTDSNNGIISIESKKSGAKNSINIIPEDSESAKVFGDIGLFSSKSSDSLTLNFDNKEPEAFSFVANGYDGSVSAIIESKSSTFYNLKNSISDSKEGKIGFVYKTSKVVNQNSEVSGNEIKKNIGIVSIKDIVIHSADMLLNKITGKKEVEHKSGNMVIILYDNDGNTQDIKISETAEWTPVENKISLENISKISIKNESNDNLLIDNVSIKTKSKGTSFKNVARNASDAKMKIDGIDVTRDKNDNIDDVIDGANITLKQTTEKPITADITIDDKQISDKLNEFIEQYNNIIDLLDEAGKTSENAEPGKSDKKNRGILSNDISLVNLKSKLRSTVISSYETSFKNQLAMLAQIGITTGKWGTAWADIKKGHLQLDDSQLDVAINQFRDRLGEIFGYDTNSDKVIDTGVAFTLEKVLSPYIMPKGRIDGKISLAELTIKDTEKNIEKKEEDAEKYKEDLKEKFGKMESALQRLKGLSQAVNNGLGNLNTNTESKNKETE